ncbi:M48 family metallopeptidase [Myxococcota bacterium]|nr:M48 family metallopeptidase [Myxococcota bacterium]
MGLAARIACVALFSVGCASTHDYVTGEATFNRYSLTEEVDLGVRQATLIIASAEQLGLAIDPDVPATHTVRTIAARILAVPENRARMPALPWEVHVIDDPAINAWTLPGGQVLVMTGLFDSGFLTDEDEAAAVIGHEMAHAAARHATERRSVAELRRWIEPLGEFLGPRLVELVAPERPADLMRSLGESAPEFDQGQELEADIIGLELMTRAGYDPAKAPKIWKRLAQAGLQSPTTLGAPALPSPETRGLAEGRPQATEATTHPPAERRSIELERHLPVVTYLRARQVTRAPVDPPKTAWRFGGTHTSTRAPRRLPAEGALVAGAQVERRWIEPPPELLALGVDLRRTERIDPTTGASHPELRVAATLTSARELHEDHLRFTGILFIERADAPGAPSSRSEVLHAQTFARSRELDAPKVTLTLPVPPLAPGEYVARVRVLLGALWLERTESLVITP